MKTGIELIQQERSEQIEKHGRSVEDDVKYNTNGELWKGAKALIDEDFEIWPEEWDFNILFHIQNKPRIEQLAICGALIAAEIDRLNSTPSQNKQDINKKSI